MWSRFLNKQALILIKLLVVCIYFASGKGCGDTEEGGVVFGDEALEALLCRLELLNKTTAQVQAEYQTLNEKIAQFKKELLDDKLPESCADAMGEGNVNGVYRLYLPKLVVTPFNVYCMRDPKNEGGAWTVIQRRQDGSEDFFRNWYDYKHGFGDVNKEYFLGLDKLHAMTEAQPQELWIELMDFDNISASAHYDSFAIGNEEQKYNLETLGAYDGNAGDALRGHLGKKFSTKDNDNSDSGNCANYYITAWWLNNCYTSSLNGKYFPKEGKKDGDSGGVDWNFFRSGSKSSLKYAHMAIRPKNQGKDSIMRPR